MPSAIYERILARKPFIVAEAGVNHNGDLRIAKKLVDVAADSGADAVKFQTFKAEKVVTVRAAKAAYQLAATDPTEKQFEMLKRLELPEGDHIEVKRTCEQKGILFLSTAFDAESADMLDRLGMPVFKIPSGELTNLPLVDHIARKGKPLIVSTGMSTLEEVREALEVIHRADNREVILLHCVTAYPAPEDQANLRAILTLRETFHVPVGFSDHTPGFEITIAAVAVGAQVIEKHFTLDRKMAGPDHKASLEPCELRAMVRALRKIEASLGDGVKRPAPCEAAIAPIARRSLVASREIPKGSVLSLQDVDIKRPGDGIPPKFYKEIVGRKAETAIGKDELITWEKLA